MFNRFGEIAFEAVPLERFGLASRWKKLAAVQGEAAEMIRRYKAAERDVATLEAGRVEARDKDLRAAAVAVRAGKEAPPAAAEADLDRDLSAAIRQRDILERAASDAIEEAHALRAKHAPALSADIREALGKKAAELADHARRAAALYAEVEDGKQTASRLIPAPPPVESNAPAQDTQVFINGPAMSTMRGPARGEIEAALSYIASMEAAFSDEGRLGAA